MSAAAAMAKAASVILSDERGRKAVGWILVAVLSPLILLIAILCSLGAGSAEHNHSAVDACFYGTALTQDMPQEYKSHVTQMRSAFSVLDSAVGSVNEIIEGGSLDPVRIKASFYALCFVLFNLLIYSSKQFCKYKFILPFSLLYPSYNFILL